MSQLSAFNSAALDANVVEGDGSGDLINLAPSEKVVVEHKLKIWSPKELLCCSIHLRKGKRRENISSIHKVINQKAHTAE